MFHAYKNASWTFFVSMKICCCAGDFQRTMKTIFDDWKFEGIIPCHGDVLQSGGKAVLKEHLGIPA